MGIGPIGATRATPGRLFDPEDPADAPPPDALDVQFRAPVSFSQFVDDLFATGRDADGRACFSLYEQVMPRTIRRLQEGGGYVLDEHGEPWPARLDLAAYGESMIPGVDGVRMHHHLYVGRTAVSLHDGRRLPVDPTRLDRAADGAHSVATLVLRELTEERFGLQWYPPPNGYSWEIVDPPVYERTVNHLDAAAWDAALGVCPSPWGRRTTWTQPSRDALDMMAADAALIVRDQAAAPTR